MKKLHFLLRAFSSTSPSVEVNEVGIQLLPTHLQRVLFPAATTRKTIPKWKMDAIRRHLQKQDLWNKPTTTVPPVDFFTSPPLEGKDLYDHFQNMAKITHGNYLSQSLALCRSSLPPVPTEWNLKQPGWTKYNADTNQWTPIDYPKDEGLIFDVEVAVKYSKFPIIATAASPTNWYSWISPVIFDKQATSTPSVLISSDHTVSSKFQHLIPLGSMRKERIVVGHFVSYDRARIEDEYDVRDSRIRYLDTMSLHVAVAGLSSTQRMKYQKITKEMDRREETGVRDEDSFEQDDMAWYTNSSLNGLKHVAKFHVGIAMDKSARDLFVHGEMQEIVDALPELMSYCANDVYVTHCVFQKVLPKVMAGKLNGNLVSFSGMLEMGSSFLPVSKQWPKYIETCEKMVSEKQEVIEKSLIALAEEFLQASSEDRGSDHYLRQLDWRETSKRNPNPKWYSALLPSKAKTPHITIRTNITPLLLQMTWQNFPLYYLGRTFGWCYRVPTEDVHKINKNMKPVPIEDMRKSVKALLYKSKTGICSEERHLHLMESDQSRANFYRLPSPSKSSDTEANCGSPMSKTFLDAFSDGKMSSTHEVAKTAIEANILASYWISARERIKNQFIVWNNECGILIPSMATMGTVTRRAVEPTWLTASNPKKTRIGSEVKTLIKPPKGYKLVGADVDSQELWIAGLLGDAQFGVHGGTAVGWMTLQGNKADGTDLHSKSAQILGASRDQAKIFNYARIYGSGLKFSANLLSKCDPTITPEDAVTRAMALYRHTKGIKVKSRLNRYRKIWSGGSESLMFNALENIALSEDPRTPTMRCQLPDSLMPMSARLKYITSCVNWVVQSSGVDYLHMLIVSMSYLCKKYDIDARLLITIHDEIRFMVKEEDSKRAALAMQISNLWTRSLFADSVGIPNLPLSVAFFSAVDVDHVLRKEVYDPCKTPSLPEGISEKGQSFSVYDLEGTTLGTPFDLKVPHLNIPPSLPTEKSKQVREDLEKKFIDAQI